MPLLIAHRGASALELENSLAAFRKAVELGADGIELDVHSTADGVMVVHHDPTIDGFSIPRTAHRSLRTARLPNGEPLSTLDEALATIGRDVIAFIELKTLPAGHDQALFHAIDRAPSPAQCHVHGFDHRIVRRLHDARATLPCGILSSSYPIEPLRQLEAAGATELWQHDAVVDSELIDRVHGGGGTVFVWTVDDPARLQQLASWGVDGLCTNRPDLAREALA